eukprot:3941723-Rhodomonas_salina.2
MEVGRRARRARGWSERWKNAESVRAWGQDTEISCRNAGKDTEMPCRNAGNAGHGEAGIRRERGEGRRKGRGEGLQDVSLRTGTKTGGRARDYGDHTGARGRHVQSVGAGLVVVVLQVVDQGLLLISLWSRCGRARGGVRKLEDDAGGSAGAPARETRTKTAYIFGLPAIFLQPFANVRLRRHSPSRAPS